MSNSCQSCNTPLAIKSGPECVNCKQLFICWTDHKQNKYPSKRWKWCNKCQIENPIMCSECKVVKVKFGMCLDCFKEHTRPKTCLL